MPDEGLQEIQLRGKQLVFLAMSATVVAVVIFLCGVMVGRGVPTARQALTGPIEPDVFTPASDPDAASPTPEPLEPNGVTPPPLEYPADLVRDQPSSDKPLKASPAARPFAEPAVAGPSTSRRPTPAAAPTTPRSSATPATTPAKASEPAATAPATAGSGGFQVQVAAYQRQGDASTLRDRLVKKGYPAAVTSASTSAGTWFRVRVGGYDTRNEAQAIAARLKRDEQLEPWVTR